MKYNLYIYLCVKYTTMETIHNYVDFLVDTILYNIENLENIENKLKEQYNKKIYTKHDTWLINNINNINKYTDILISVGIPMEIVSYIEQHYILKKIEDEENEYN